MKMEKDFFPVGREVAGIVLDGKFTELTKVIMQKLIMQKCFPFF